MTAAMWMLAGSVGVSCITGCRTAREEMQETRRPRNTVVTLKEIPPEFMLATSEGAAVWLWDRTATQSIYVLKVAADATLEERYHEDHDLVLLCLSGKAIISVEGERYYLEAPGAVMVPRLYAYKIMPSDGTADFVALELFSPPLDGEDLVLTGAVEEPPRVAE